MPYEWDLSTVPNKNLKNVSSYTKPILDILAKDGYGPGSLRDEEEFRGLVFRKLLEKSMPTEQRQRSLISFLATKKTAPLQICGIIYLTGCKGMDF
ncbi:hypothetical protein CDAR_319231 [Caerostris darwini]|uniref:Uncharacterized protein n=1 Tax=Caerostris darwini TaxID=1538125 RepID=A0AAV4TYN4_9ARAC|nr:hypothetical protein CDAR_319231 [Caerostris darwini]